MFLAIPVTTVIYGQDVEPTSGGIAVFPLATEPPTLNSYLANSGWEALLGSFIYESLATVGPDGNYIPVLAQEIPTRENGGVSQDGLVITWRLKQGVVWSDGEPFTADDVLFTWEATSNLSSGVVWNPGVEQIASVITPDDYTVVITYSEFYPEFLGQFGSTNSGGQGILPRHGCGEPSEMRDWACNRSPIGTGPFVLEDWRSGESLTFVRNPLYREPGKPYLDRIVFPLVPDSAVHYQMMLNHDADIWWFFDQQYIGDFVSSDVVDVNRGQFYTLRLFFNLGQDSVDGTQVPHPILGDLAVRQAIKLAIDVNAINSIVYSNLGVTVRSEFYNGPYVCPAPVISYDAQAAQNILDEHGYVDRNGDRVRELDDGTPLLLRLVTTDDESPLTLVQQIIADNLADIGIQLDLRLDATYVDQALAGDFDMVMWTDDNDPTADPAYFASTYYPSSSIPQYNIMHYRSPVVDRIFQELGTQFDYDERLALFCQLDDQLAQDLPVLFLLGVPYPSAFSSRLHGWQENPNAILTWDIANWWLSD